MRWLLVDQLLECVPGRHAVAVKAFALSDPIFVTHFPGNPVVPGVLQIEMVAQAAAKSLRVFRPGMMATLASVKSARFLRPVVPGDRCVARVSISPGDDHAVASGMVEVDGVRACQMELLLALRPRAIVEPLERDTVIHAWLRRNGGRQEPSVAGAHAAPVAV